MSHPQRVPLLRYFSHFIIPTCHGFPHILAKPYFSTMSDFRNPFSTTTSFPASRIPYISLTLKRFLPLAGKLVIPLSSGMPVSHYAEGDSIAMSGAAELDDFVPQLTHQIVELPATAIQITLFPNHHVGHSRRSHCRRFCMRVGFDQQIQRRRSFGSIRQRIQTLLRPERCL